LISTTTTRFLNVEATAPRLRTTDVYINQNIIHISHQASSEQRVQVIIKKETEVIHEGTLPVTHKLDKCTYKVQFRKQIRFNQEWYTYKVWTQELSVQNKQDSQPEQKLIKKGNRTTVKVPEAHHKRQYGIMANANYINNQDDVTKQTHTTTSMASTIIISIIFLFIFLFIISSYIIYHMRRRNRHDRHSAFPLVNIF